MLEPPLRRHVRRLLAQAFVLLTLLWPCLSHGQTEPVAAGDEPAEYRAAIAIAAFEYKVVGNFVEARAQFLKAHELYPNAHSLRGLGMTELAMHHYKEAVSYLEQALGERVKPLEGETRDATASLLERAYSQVARIHLKAEPANTIVVVDDESVPAYAQGTLVLALGAHVLEFSAAERKTQIWSMNVLGGEQQTLNIALQKPPALDLTLQKDLPEIDQSRRWYKSPWLWGVLGVAFVGTAVGLGLGLRERHTTEVQYSGGSTDVVLAGPR